MIGKWAMTLDGKLATRTGSSRWISNDGSRRIVHELRGRVDAILVGRGTAVKDNPLLTARSRALRNATRIVVDSRAARSVRKANWCKRRVKRRCSLPSAPRRPKPIAAD